MSQSVGPGAPVRDAAPPERAGGAPKRNHDCDVCVVGNDVAGLVLAADLARRGREVLVLAPMPPARPWPLDGVISPGFTLPTEDLVARVGREDAHELLILSTAAAKSGLALAERFGVTVGPRGRLTVARAHAADDLRREHDLRQALAPDTTVLVGAGDLAALLATDTFALGLGVVPAERVPTEALRAALEAEARAAGVRILSVEGALSADLKGVRKYLDTANQRVRAFQVVITGAAAFARLGPKVARLPRTPWVSGGFRVPGLAVPYAGVVEETGLTGLTWHVDGDRLALAAATATPMMTRVGAARVLRRHAAEAYGVGSSLVEGARGRWLPETGGMPLLHEGERGVWYALIPGAGVFGLDFLAARLIAGALADRDDRIALLQPFASGTLTGWAGRIARTAGYWHLRLAARLFMEKAAKPVAAQEPVLDAGLIGLPVQPPEVLPAEAAESALPPPRDPHRVSGTATASARARQGVAAATSASRHAARAALHAASGWASGIAARAASGPSRRRRPAPEPEDDTPPQRR
ncbi:FAD-dependent oxidoreductase [Xanthobacter sp. KR7-65]|uniref:FAD-dependent oxidoreductase n=1 Tax=Xanthobacter sp. KR7-65 TaxID=3156612 RepID=UPI0032B4EBF3